MVVIHLRTSALKGDDRTTRRVSYQPVTPAGKSWKYIFCPTGWYKQIELKVLCLQKNTCKSSCFEI